jgi:hypothetical protein
MLVSEYDSSYHTFLDVNESNFNVIVFRDIDNEHIENGYFSLEGLELLDESLLDDFADSISWRWLPTPCRNSDRTRIIIERWSAELSHQQLNNVWRMMDNVVKKYEEPLQPVGFTIMRTIIDDEFYWGEFLPYFDRDARIRRADRHEFESTDINLLILTHYLAETVPIRMGWKYNFAPIIRTPPED